MLNFLGGLCSGRCWCWRGGRGSCSSRNMLCDGLLSGGGGGQLCWGSGFTGLGRCSSRCCAGPSSGSLGRKLLASRVFYMAFSMVRGGARRNALLMKELVKAAAAAAAGLAGCALSAPAVGGCPEPSSADMAVYAIPPCAAERFPRFSGSQVPRFPGSHSRGSDVDLLARTQK